MFPSFGGLLHIRESSLGQKYRHTFTKIHIVRPHKQLQQRIRTSRKRVIGYYMPENMPDSWGCQLPILCVHVIMCPVLTVRVSFSLLPTLPALAESGLPPRCPAAGRVNHNEKPAHFSTICVKRIRNAMPATV